MTNTQVVLLVVQGLVSAVVALYIMFEWFKGKREQQKYKLFATRDRLIGLAATGKLSQGDPLFKLFYGAINTSIAEVKDLTLTSLVKASISARRELERRQQAEEFLRNIRAARPEVKEFVGRFAFTMMEIMLANNLMLVFLLRLGYRGRKHIERMIRPNMFIIQRKEVQTYRYFEKLNQVESNDDLHDCQLV